MLRYRRGHSIRSATDMTTLIAVDNFAWSSRSTLHPQPTPSRVALGVTCMPRPCAVSITPARMAQSAHLTPLLGYTPLDTSSPSGLARTVHTASIIAQQQQWPVHAVPVLQEMPLAGGSGATSREGALASMAQCRQRTQHPASAVMVPGPISFGALCQRSLAAISRTMPQFQVETVRMVWRPSYY